MGRATAILSLALASACSQTLPPEAASSALYRDLQRMVRVRQATPGWRIDRISVEALEGDALDSICRTTPETRARTLAWIDAEMAKRGGSVEAEWRRAGKDFDKIGVLLELSRIRMLLVTAGAKAETDCSFWMEPTPSFHGLQIYDDRWHAVGEFGGRVVLLRSGDQYDFSAGGSGRALIGRGIGSRLDLLTGVEITGSAEFLTAAGQERSGPVLALTVVAPAVVRWRMVNTYIEGEVGWLGHITEIEDLVNGVHFGVGFGIRGLRVRWFIPGLAFSLNYERTIPGDARRVQEFFKAGLRVTFDFDL